MCRIQGGKTKSKGKEKNKNKRGYSDKERAQTKNWKEIKIVKGEKRRILERSKGGEGNKRKRGKIPQKNYGLGTESFQKLDILLRICFSFLKVQIRLTLFPVYFLHAFGWNKLKVCRCVFIHSLKEMASWAEIKKFQRDWIRSSRKNEMIKKMKGKLWKSAPYDDKLNIRHENDHMEQSDRVVSAERL